MCRLYFMSNVSLTQSWKMTELLSFEVSVTLIMSQSKSEPDLKDSFTVFQVGAISIK